MLLLPNCDLDTGKATEAAEYSSTDETYAELLARLTDRKFDLMSAILRENILQCYSDMSAPIETKKDEGRWRKVLATLDQVKSATPVPAIAVGAAPGTPVPPAKILATRALPAAQ